MTNFGCLKAINKLFVIASIALLLVGCTRNPSVYVTNQSPATLTNIIVSGPGFSLPFSQLASGAQQKIPLNLKPNTIKFEFDALGKHFSDVSTNINWNGMKAIDLSVATNFSVDHGMITTF